MADDVAALGFEVDSTQLRTGTAELARLDAQARRTGGTVDDFGSRVSGLQAGLVRTASGIAAFTAAFAGIAGVGGLVGAFVQQTIEAENAMAQLNAAIKATGGAAGLSADQLTAMADSLQGLTTFSDDAIIKAEGLLLRYDRIGSEVFPRALKAITDVAAATGKDLNSAVTQVGRALQDPITGMQALSRAGVQFTQGQREQIRALAESGQRLEAQKLILKELESRYEGAASAARDTLGGALQALRNAFDNLFEVTNSPESERLRQSIEQLVALLSSPETQAAFQAFGGFIFEQITSTIRTAIVEVNRISAAINQLKSLNIGEGLRTLLGAGSDLQRATDLLKFGGGTQMGAQEVTSFYKSVGIEAATAAPKVKEFAEETKAVGGATKDLVEQTSMAEWLNANVQALGSAATAMERYQAHVETLRLSLNEGKISQDTFNRAVTQLHPTVKSLQDVVGDLGDAMAQAFIHGKSGADALGSSLKAIASTASSDAIKGLLKGLTGGGFDFTSILTGGLIGVGASLLSKFFGGGGDDQGAQQQAAAAAQAKADREQILADAQVRAAEFNMRAADAMSKSDFISELQRFDFESQRQFDVESKLAGDLAINQLIAARAAERMALIMEGIDEATQTLSGAQLSDVQRRMQEIAEASATLTAALAAQGEATDKAAEMTAAAIAKLSGAFIDDLVRQVNELAGGAWINQAEDLIAKVQQLRSDAAALGIATSLIDTFYVLTAQSIIDQNQLIGGSFDALVRMLNLAGAGLHEFNAAIEETARVAVRSAQEIQSTIQGFQDQLFILQQNQDTLAGKLAVFEREALRARQAEIAKGGQALAALIALQEAQKAKIIADWNKKIAEEQQAALEEALEAQKKAAEEQKKLWQDAVDFIEGIRDRITQFVTGFLAGPQSFLSPQQQMQVGIEAFNKQLAAAQGGDKEALSNITASAQTALDAIKAYYGSTATGAALQKNIINQLTALPNQLSPEMFIVKATEDQTAALQADNAAQLDALLSIKLAADMATMAQDATAANTAQTAAAIEMQAAATAVQAENWSTALVALAEIGSNTAATANVIPLRLSVTEGLLGVIDATLRDGFTRMISAIVVSSEAESIILRLMQADLSTMAKAERRAA